MSQRPQINGAGHCPRRSRAAGFCAALLLLAGGWTLSAARAAITVDFQVEPNIVRVGEAVAVRMTVRGWPQPTAPALDFPAGLSVSPPTAEYGSHLRIVNGRQARDEFVTFTYQVVALRAGVYNLGPLRYRTPDGIIERPAVRLEVLDPRPRGDGEAADAPILIARLEPETARIYNQQSFGLVLALYAREVEVGGDLNLDGLAAPQLSFGRFDELPARREAVQGHVYTVRRYRTRATALAAGPLELAPRLALTLLVDSGRGRARDPFFRAFSSPETRRVELPVEPLRLEIQPLPAANRPASFNGAVGRFRLEATAAPTQLQVGEPITLRARVTGQGNWEVLAPPALEPGPAFRLFDAETIETQTDRGGTGHKIFEWVAIPQTNAVTELPPVAFSFFDPERETYVELTQGPFAIEVTAAAADHGSAVPLYAASADREIEILGADLHYLKPAPRRWRPARHALPGAAPDTLRSLAPPVLLYGLLAAAWLGVSRLRRDSVRLRRHQAPRVAAAGLRRLRATLRKDPAADAYDLLWETLSAYFTLRLNLPPGAFDPATLLPRLRQAQCPAPLTDALSALLERAQTARFSSGSPPPPLNTADLKTVRQVIRCCERSRL